MIDFYVILFHAVTKNPEKVGHGRDGYYFGIGKDSDTEYSMYELAEAVGKALVALGVHKESEPTTFSNEDLVKTLGSEVSPPLLCVPSGTRLTGSAANGHVFHLDVWRELPRRSKPLEGSGMEPSEGHAGYARERQV